jgi:hypothetical protein
MRAHAEKLGIHFLFNQPGLTDEFQLLDRFAFGAMKGMCNRFYPLCCRSHSFYLIHEKIATAFLIRAWEGLCAYVLEEAWSAYNLVLNNQQSTTQ